MWLYGDLFSMWCDDTMGAKRFRAVSGVKPELPFSEQASFALLWQRFSLTPQNRKETLDKGVTAQGAGILYICFPRLEISSF